MASDNPFAEPDDSDRTVIRPAPGGRRAPAPTQDATLIRADAAMPVASAELFDAEAVNGGSDPLTGAATPLLLLLSRLRNTVSQPDPDALRERTVGQIRKFEQSARKAGISLEQLRPAHYALCASLDDVVLATPWGSTGSWAARSLCSTFHQEVASGDRFFDVLAHVRQSHGTALPVLALMYLCLSLGFQGRYRLSPRGPAELDRIREEVYSVLARHHSGNEPDLSPRWQGVSVPYRPPRAVLPVWVAGTFGLAVVAALYTWISFGLAARSDAVFERMVAALPNRMPEIERAAIPQALPPAPPSDTATPLDRLRIFLKPEIEQGLVAVVGTETSPGVRIHNRGLFASGSATVQPRFIPLLEHIGGALNDEIGSVAVIGYTDNQPIRTVQFPSNFQLSAARAKAAMAAMARTIREPSRLTAEGRADADPIASNVTAEGRDENRRIEIVLHRAG